MKITSVLLVVLVFGVGLVLGFQLSTFGIQGSDKATEPERQSAIEQPQEANTVMSAAGAENAAKDTATAHELTLLQNKVQRLEQQLITSHQQLELATLRLQQAEQPELAGSEEKETPTTISLQQAQSFLPEPFASLIAKQQGQAIDYLKLHQAEEIDGEWAYDVEQKVRDYFAAHENTAKVKLSSVSCKTTICEIRGYQYEPHSFTVIYNSMSAERWWRYGSSYSFQSGEKQEAYFYLLAELTR